jgi:hypothetical protein
MERTSFGRQLHSLKSSAFHGALFRQLTAAPSICFCRFEIEVTIHERRKVF